MEKLVRGLTHIQLKQLIEAPHAIRMQLLAPQNAWIFNDQLDKFATMIDRSPAIRARVARAASDPLSAIYEFIIWESLAVHAYVSTETKHLTPPPPDGRLRRPHGEALKRSATG